MDIPFGKNRDYTSKEEYQSFVEFVNNFIIGARMCDDEENALRASRALRAFEASIEENIFSEEFVEKEASSIFGDVPKEE